MRTLIFLFLSFFSSVGFSTSLVLMSDVHTIEKWLDENRDVLHPVEIERAERLLQHKLESLPKSFDLLKKPKISVECPQMSFEMPEVFWQAPRVLGVTDDEYQEDYDQLIDQMSKSQESLDLAKQKMLEQFEQTQQKIVKQMQRVQNQMCISQEWFEFSDICLQTCCSLSSEVVEEKPRLATGSELAICPVCTDGFTADERLVIETCGHMYHADCVKVGVDASLHQSDDRFLSCVFEGCDGFVPSEVLVQLYGNAKSSVRIQLQKLVLSKFLKVSFCPSCGLGVKNSSEASEGMCTYCYKSICFDCGHGNHPGEKCDTYYEKLKTYKEVLKHGLRVGLCPNCDSLIEYVKGCSLMRCGDHAHTSSDVTGRGCGVEFQWPSRKRVPECVEVGSGPDCIEEKVESQFPKLSEAELRARVAAGEVLFDVLNPVLRVQSVSEAFDVIRLGGSVRGRLPGSDVLDADRLYLESQGIVFRDGSLSEYSSEDAGFTYYVWNLAGVDFEFVKVPGKNFGLFRKKDFFVMSHWVTQGQWEAVMGENPMRFAGGGLDLPVKYVSYNNIVNRFLPRLNDLLQEAGFEGAFKLPSDAQWQRMANKNVATDFTSNKSKYSDFGKDLTSEQPSPVKSKERGNLGAWMFGSVWEWVGIPNASGLVAIRGGSWLNYSESVGPSARDSSRSDRRNRSIGLRLLRTFPGQA